MTPEAKWTDFASLDGAKTLAAANRLLPAWVTSILVVIIAWQLAAIIWMLVPGSSAGDPVTVPSNQLAVMNSTGDFADVNAIAEAHLFGVASAGTPDVQVPIYDATENLRDTRIANLTLKGTIASSPDEVAIAIIAADGDKDKIYSIGDSVTVAARLHAVYADRVVLDENGVLTNLKLPKEFPAGRPTSTRRNTTTSARMTRNTPSIQSVVARNVSKLADVIRPTPYFVNGQQQGYRVYPGRDRAQFTALGLRPGDLIKDIDGQSLTDPSQAMQIFQSLGDSDQVSVTVERNGQAQIIILKTSQLDIANETNR